MQKFYSDDEKKIISDLVNEIIDAVNDADTHASITITNSSADGTRVDVSGSVAQLLYALSYGLYVVLDGRDIDIGLETVDRLTRVIQSIEEDKHADESEE